MLRHRSNIWAAGIALACALLVPLDVVAQETSDGVVPAYLRHIEGTVSVQRAAAGDTDEAIVNLPLDTGDRVWTEDDGRAEIVLDDGTVVWLDQRSTLDIVHLPLRAGETVLLRLWAGSAFVSRPDPERDRQLAVVRVDAPAGSAVLPEAGLVRVDVDDDQRLWLSVFTGSAELVAGGLSEPLRAGEQSVAEVGSAPARAVTFNTAEQDDFAAWQAQLVADRTPVDRYATERPYVPQTIVHHTTVLHGYGQWHYYDDYRAWAWRPYVGVSWSPYRHGRWVWTHHGWVWVPFESWGYVTVHYGRWHFTAGHGWVWFPGRVWSPAWVQWYVSPRHVGWVPLNFFNRPAVSVSFFFNNVTNVFVGDRGTTVRHGGAGSLPVGPQGSSSGRARLVNGLGYTSGLANAWTFVDAGELAAADVSRVAVQRDDAATGFQQRTQPRSLISGALRSRQPTDLLPRTGARQAVPRGSIGDAGASGVTPRPLAGSATRGDGTPAGTAGGGLTPRTAVPRRSDATSTPPSVTGRSPSLPTAPTVTTPRGAPRSAVRRGDSATDPSAGSGITPRSLPARPGVVPRATRRGGDDTGRRTVVPRSSVPRAVPRGGGSVAPSPRRSVAPRGGSSSRPSGMVPRGPAAGGSARPSVTLPRRPPAGSSSRPSAVPSGPNAGRSGRSSLGSSRGVARPRPSIGNRAPSVSRPRPSIGIRAPSASRPPRVAAPSGGAARPPAARPPVRKAKPKGGGSGSG